ncbi:MAG: GspE/PulE family protein [Vulcanimicrobiaceae bacterium]
MGGVGAVAIVDRLHDRAVHERASDIHVEPTANGARIRLRVDGRLRQIESLDERIAGAVISRFKVLAGMDIAERRLPQDGRYSFDAGSRQIDARVASLPGREGEKLAIRLLDLSARSPSVRELGMADAARSAFCAALDAAFGFIVVCGPTGSGKTTTVYAALDRLNTPERNICTIEDPVERVVAGVTQVQVNPRAGLTFDRVMRGVLRHDPDVIMIGEMRDSETAATAAGAALSGQLVLTTLHSADAPRAIERLIELGVSRAALAAGLSAVLAQRLVRRRCVACSPAGEDSVRPNDCLACGGSGFRERIGLFELLLVDDSIREAIAGGASFASVGRLANAGGYRPLRVDAREKLACGITTPAEVVRALGALDE